MSSKSGDAPLGPNRPGLSRMRKTKVWKCRVCGYSPNLDSQSPNCVNCGRDFWGNPGVIPTGITRDGT